MPELDTMAPPAADAETRPPLAVLTNMVNVSLAPPASATDTPPIGALAPTSALMGEVGTASLIWSTGLAFALTSNVSRSTFALVIPASFKADAIPDPKLNRL